ncbi:hypothetical protein BHM03_00008010 [Ensete ventricosum]|nr:hypothetical protein BHM03_00008010 [Ensete ventricosum]
MVTTDLEQEWSTWHRDGRRLGAGIADLVQVQPTCHNNNVNIVHDIIKYRCRFGRNLRTIWGRTTSQQSALATLKVVIAVDFQQTPAALKALTRDAINIKGRVANPVTSSSFPKLRILMS